jgi:hypothetical protein
MTDQTQNVLVSFTEEEARLLRHTLESALERTAADAQLFNGTETGDRMIKELGQLYCLARRIRMTAYEAKQERISREAVK